MNVLKIATAGSVDDGKSTLIGRLLYDSKSIFEDQLEAIESTSRKKGAGAITGCGNSVVFSLLLRCNGTCWISCFSFEHRSKSH